MAMNLVKVAPMKAPLTSIGRTTFTRMDLQQIVFRTLLQSQQLAHQALIRSEEGRKVGRKPKMITLA